MRQIIITGTILLALAACGRPDGKADADAANAEAASADAADEPSNMDREPTREPAVSGNETAAAGPAELPPCGSQPPAQVVMRGPDGSPVYSAPQPCSGPPPIDAKPIRDPRPAAIRAVPVQPGQPPAAANTSNASSEQQ